MSATAFFWLVALPLGASPVVYVIGRLGANQDPEERAPATVRWLTLLVLLATWFPFSLAAKEVAQKGRVTFNVGTIGLQLDGVSILLAASVLALGTAVALHSVAYMAKEVGEEKYYAMLLAMIGVMIGLGCANDLFNLWVWFEAMAVSSYLLVAFYREQPASLEAGMKYLVQSALGSVLVLMGIALVLAQTGTLHLDKIRPAAHTSPALLAAGALFIIGFGVKIAMVPMHTWLPDAHSQAPSGISAMLSGVVIEAGLVALLRALIPLVGVTPSWGTLLMGFGALNMLYGNLLALKQEQVKRLLAFSSLSHVGYMLLGLGISLHVGQSAGAQGAFFHLFNHGLMKGSAFLAAGSMLYALHLAAGSHAPLTIQDLSGAAKRYPMAALALSVAVLALGGLPPLAGFMSKWQIFVAGFATHNVLIASLVIFAAMNSVLSLAYYAPLVNAVYRKEPSLAVTRGAALPRSMVLPLTVLTVLIVVLGLWPSSLNWLTEPAGAALVAAIRG
ncbi:MAG TPA: proton-conducting transporter membrane subunit [Candidatus Methylomirabilis sp.]|nr:proton-conducting transporter membrane subunit [Candidatus Methylomirabilis sp.]